MTHQDPVREALEAARQFIVNGVEFGYILMPDKSTPDSAHDTLPMIDKALAALASTQVAPVAEVGVTERGTLFINPLVVTERLRELKGAKLYAHPPLQAGEAPHQALQEAGGAPSNVREYARQFVANGYRGPLHAAKTVFDWVHSLSAPTNEKGKT